MNMNMKRPTMNLLHFWRVFRRWWWLPVTTALFAGGTGYLFSKRTPPVYQTSTRLLVSSAQPTGPTSYDDTLASASLAQTYREFAVDSFILRQTIDGLHLRLTLPRLAQEVDAQVVRNTPLVEITVQDGSPTRAAAIADKLAQALATYVNRLQTRPVQAAGQQVSQQIAALRKTLANVTAQLNRLRTTRFPNAATATRVQQLQEDVTGYQNQLTSLIDTQRQITIGRVQTAATLTALGPAPVPVAPVQPQPLRTLALAGLIGFLLALGVALLLDLVDDRVREPADIESFLGVPPLAVVGLVPERGSQRLHNATLSKAMAMLTPGGRTNSVRLLSGSTVSTGTRFTEDIVLLRASLDTVMLERQAVLCVSSARDGEGKSTIAANLAILAAQSGKQVILVDANLRDPQLHHYFELTNDHGLSGYLTPKPGGAHPPLQDGPLNIKILAAGAVPPDPTALLGSLRMVELIHMLRARADVVIVDTGPILASPDAILLHRLADGTVLIADTQRARRGAIVASLAALQQVSGTVLGVVLNKSEQRTTSRGYSTLITPTEDMLLLNQPVKAKADGVVSSLRQAGL